MSIESDMVKTLGPLVSGRVYPDETPENPVFPLIIYQQAGGESSAYVDNKRPDLMNARMQVMVWAERRGQASNLGREVERIMIESSSFTAPKALGAQVSLRNGDLEISGTRQDFSLWFKSA